ncbi:MAG: hypothetical protein SPL89_07030, partial [Clostridia bacterium]|nr:hypothetical protein [Clostridia bacterium]
MKIKRLSAIILSLIMLLGSVSAFAQVPELSEEYYGEVTSYDFQEQTDAVSELPKTGDSNGMAKGYFKEEDGNIAWYGYRTQNGSGGWTNAGFSIPSSVAMASGVGDDRGGEYVIQSRFLFIQQSDKIGNFTLQTQLDDTDNKFSQDYAGVTQMGLQFSNLSVKDSFENTPVFYFKSIIKNSEGNGVWAPEYTMTLPTIQFNGNTWYTFRQTYNLDLKTYRIEIYNAAGNKVYDESVELPTKENGSIAYDAPYSGKFYGSDLLFYMTTHNMAGNGYMIDDVSIVKTLKKNITVSYPGAYGSVEFDGKTIENGGSIAVPYNSATPVSLTVKPSSGYEVKDVKVGGVSKGKITEISLSEIKSDQTVEIEFKKEAQKEPAAPVVSDVKISGIAMISRELTASFGYSDKNDDPMTEAVYSWEVSADGKTGWSAVGENKNTFTLTENEVGKFVRVGVVAKNDAAELNTSGDPVYSSAFGPISAMKTAPWIKENSAKIAGSGNVGGGLTAEYTYEYDSASGDVEGKTEFVWEISDSENGDYTPIDGANAKIYCPTAEQTGKYIRVRITPVDINEVKGAEAVTAGIQVTDTAIEYFVATDGDDKNPGTMDKPFATLAKAKNTVRGLISKGLTSKIIVNLRGGDYRMNSGLNFDNSDSGTEEFPIVYRAYNGETVNLYGSKALDASKITKVTDDAVLDKLIEKSARDHLYQVKMSDLGISAPVLNYNGASGKNVFYFNGTELINARWPNADKSGDHFFVGAEGAELTADEQGKYNGDNQPAKMKYKDETGRSKLWQFKPGDMYAGGAFAYLWARQAVKLESLDTENNILKTAEILTRGQSTYTAADDRYL